MHTGEATALERFLHRKERIVEAGQKPFPKIYRQGRDFIVTASGFLTPRRCIAWHYLRIILFILSIIYLVLSFFAWLGSAGSPLLLFFVGVIVCGFCISAMLDTDYRWGGVFLGKKIAVEIYASKVMLYRNGYGMSFPRLIARNDRDDVDFLVEPHEARGGRQIGHNFFSRRRYETLENSFTVKIVHGNHVERVVHVYGEQIAKDIAAGLKMAVRMHGTLALGQQLLAKKQAEIPE